MAKIIDLDIVLPLIVEPVRPNTVEVGTPVVTNIGSTSFDVEQTFSSEVDYYGGIYVGESADNNDDATLVKNPGYINKTITGLRQNTTYYVNGVALPVMGNISICQQITVTTEASPIPKEYQLVEYITNDGQTTQWLKFYNIFDVDAEGYFRKYDFYVRNVGGSGYGFFFGTLGNNLGWWEVWNGSSTSDGIAVNIPVTDDFIKYTVDLPNRAYYINDLQTGYTIRGWYRLDTELCMYRRSDDWQMGSINGRVQKIVVYGGVNADRIDFEIYPVYRKSDSRPGMYDIVNNTFYTNSGTGELFVGPDKEW